MDVKENNELIKKNEMTGFSPRNIKYMRKFAECWPDFEFV